MRGCRREKHSKICSFAYKLHPTPYTLHPTPYTLHPTPYTLVLLIRQCFLLELL
ncbi:MAG: hypothetical protein F6J93_26575 [Oscillatoria sp. SIO1A7]|nr:hypothetical protein [Oscillatoria sp. SIO1A7]